MREKELRIALVCFGGVSLAVYMHGISKEILKLVRASSALHAVTDRAWRGKASFFDFADRDDLLVELITRHGRALRDRAHKTISRQDSLPDQIVESLLYIADHGSRDPLTRYLIDPDGTVLGRRMIASGASQMLRAELGDPYLDAAVANNELPPGLPRSDIYLWIGNVGKMLMRGLDDGDGDLKRYRSILRRFMAPAFASATAHVSA